VLAALLVIAFVLQGTMSVLAGTTGSISGTVTDPQSNQPVAGATVTVTSPSQSATTHTDPTGHYTFASLTPDTYTIAVTATSARDTASVSGVTVQADQSLVVNMQQPTKLRVIGSVTSRAASSIVKPGTTADVYSINAVTQDKASALGGGGTLNSAWSAISSVPGVYVSPNQSGYIGAGPTLSIRGGDYDQIGYELDGVPVNRAFDNYPSGPVSSLGQQELQVYTGAPAANAEANGISGYINQVIRTGTAPASRNLTLAFGTPSQYDKLAFEAGGANPSRTFSYYLGAGAYNQSYRYFDQYNGANLQQNYGAPLAPCPAANAAAYPGCAGPNGAYTNTSYLPAFVLGSPVLNSFLSNVQDRDTVANFHFGIPRKDGNRDDVQVLFDNNFINNPYYSSTNDLGGAPFLAAIGAGPNGYVDGYQSSLVPGSVLPVTYTGGGTSPYFFPQSPNGRVANGLINCPGNTTTSTVNMGCIEPDRRDAFTNDQSILKLQYQRNFGTNAFLRVYGYTYYSDWLQTGPQTTDLNYIGYVPSDYELESHTRGVSAQFTDQITPQHLLTIQGSYTTATTLRDNNTEMLNGLYSSFFGPDYVNFRTAVGVLVNGANPYNGVCYTRTGAPVNCYNGSGSNFNGAVGSFTLAEAAGQGTGVIPASGTCGTGPCQYLVVGNGQYATYNTVVPKFTAFSISDQWKPTDKLSIDLGLREDIFTFDGSNTAGSAARTFLYNAWNAQFPTEQQFNPSNQSESFNELEPRLGLTYTVNPSTVLRASYGRYAQAPNSAFEQYNFLQQEAPSGLVNFVVKTGFNTPMHAIRPSVANNFDFSFEHQFNRDTSVKLTPFLRKTQDQIQQFYLDQKTSFVSGVNVGAQTSQGLEFELDKGDFARNGWAGRLTYTYTNSYIQYHPFNGISVVDAINQNIVAYNKLTGAGGGSACYTPTVVNSSGTTVSTGGPAACSPTTIANPYFNAPLQPLLDPNGKYPTYDTFPAGIGAAPVTSYGAPHVATLLVQYKHGPLAVTPALQFAGGVKYGVPLANPGIDPSACTVAPGGTGTLAGTVANDPRYPYGAPGGAPYDAAACYNALNLAIPNTYTGHFDSIGGYTAPNVIQLHTQVTYDVNKRLTLVGNFANIVNHCFGGTKVPWAVSGACGYALTPGITYGPGPVGNQYNPGDYVQPLARSPYFPTFPGFPFNMYFEARLKV
jgi:hypothetical protein